MAIAGIILGAALVLIGGCNLVQAALHPNPVAAVGGVVIGLVFAVPGIPLFVIGVRRASGRGGGLQKKCPFCAELVKAEAVVCRFCGRDLPDEESEGFTIAAPQPAPQDAALVPCRACSKDVLETAVLCPYCKAPMPSLQEPERLDAHLAVQNRRSDWLVAAIIIAVLLVVLVVAAAHGGERVDFYDTQGRREGYAIVDRDSGRVDYYDNNSRRTGYGQARDDGRLDRYRLDGQRELNTRPAPILPPPRGSR